MMSTYEQPPQVISFRHVLGQNYKGRVNTDTGTSVRDEAALLLSIADIARCEISKCPSALTDDNSSCPSFPFLNEKRQQDSLTPRMGSLRGLLYSSSKIEPLPSRLRTVSFDNPKLFDIVRSTPFPLASPPKIADVLVEAVAVSPAHRRLSHRSTRFSHKAKHDLLGELKERTREVRVSSPTLISPPRKSKGLQAKPATEVTITNIFRRKFSWKNYPELEHHLVANREEYLRHSALNYTLQQKQYNNRLTEDLLKMATTYGYMFDEREFSFVTVRDRIRCYYKSFVQSAKKRGILMGYAARKAGLLDDDSCSSGSMDEDVVSPH